MDTTETTLYHAVLITSMVLVMVFFYFAYTIFRSHRRHFRVLRKHMLRERRIIEKERTLIAHNLHDDLGPLLALIKIQVSVARDKVTGDVELLHKACNNLDLLHDRMRMTAENIPPTSLKNKGLATTLHDYFEEYNRLVSINISLICDFQTKIRDDIEIQLYRTIQELVHNAVKHSGASAISVHLKEKDNKLYIHCADNGIGIPNSRRKNIRKGIGIESIHYRVQMMGGRLSLTEHEGTEYLLEIPVTNKS
jgi:signal transduction histidine kinase